MTRNAKISVVLVLVVVLLGAALVLGAGDDNVSSDGGETSDGSAQTLRPNSHLLSKGPEGAPELVEFLDFECEGCGALYPIMEELRERYDGEITVAIRYFPNESHFNAMNAALAVEAAARQGELEAMYEKMFETQEEWGEAGESKAALFESFAKELGLDMTQYRRDVADPSTEARVKKDFEEALELGVEGTPALFLDGEPLQPESLEQLSAEVDAALG